MIKKSQSNITDILFWRKGVFLEET